jgi:nucleoid-associated protein YgaU
MSADTVDETVEETIEETIEEVGVMAEVIEEASEEVIVEETPTTALIDQPREYTTFIGTEVVGKDSRLTWIAYKYYGNKDLWVFIYEANRDLISHPARVTPGQKLRIPQLENKYLDLTNPELRQLVDVLTTEYLK